MNRYFVDSNVCVYAFDKNSAHHRHIAWDLIGRNPFISSQVIIETYNACNKKLKLSSEICEENTLFLCDIAQVYEINAAVIKTAVSFKRKYNFSFLDACIVASAYHAECLTLYSEDMHNGMIIENTLTIVNPFV
jgi:predicted nucleic acid-binding protein